jgi:hypothetical protein
MYAKKNTDEMLWVDMERVSAGSVQTTRCDPMDTESIQLDLRKEEENQRSLTE